MMNDENENGNSKSATALPHSHPRAPLGVQHDRLHLAGVQTLLVDRINEGNGLSALNETLEPMKSSLLPLQIRADLQQGSSPSAHPPSSPFFKTQVVLHPLGKVLPDYLRARDLVVLSSQKS